MKIGIDCRTILNPDKGEGAGIGHYVYQLVRHLLKVDKKNTYVLFFDRSVQKRRLAKFKQNNVVIRFFPFIQYTRLMPVAYSHFLASAYLAREKLDVFHSPTLSLPLSYQAPSVITIHDLAIYKFPELFPGRQKFLLKRNIPNAVQQAKRIIAVSRSTAKDIKEIFNIPAEKIKVIFHGLDKRFFASRTAGQVKKVKAKYGLDKEYLLFLGVLDSRKNIVRIISAYERLRNKIARQSNSQNFPPNKKLQLVLAGARGFKFRQIKKKILSSEYKKDIVLPGYIEADDLDSLFAGAKIFVFPSLYEGFGLPIIEAMANGVPVITSNISSMPEIAKGQAILVDPYNVAEIAGAMYNLLIDRELRRSLGQSGREHARIFDWEKSAKATLGVYKEVFSL